MKNSKKAASILVGISLAATTAAAANLSVSLTSDDSLRITGTEFVNGRVSITVAHSSEGDAYTENTNFVSIKELTPDWQGNISYTTQLPKDTVSGNYTVAAYDKSGEVKQTFFYLNKEAAEEAFSKLEDKTASTPLKDTLNAYKAELGITDDLADPTLDIDKMAELFGKFSPDDGFDADSFNICWLSSKLCGGKTYTAEEFAAEIDANSELLGVTKDGENLIPYASLNADDKAKVFEKFVSIEKTADSFADNLNEAAFLWAINEEDLTRSNFEKLVFEDYTDYLGIDTDDYEALQSPENVVSALMRDTYNSSADFEKAFYDAVYNQELAETPSRPNGGGGGGSVSSSGSFGGSITPAVPDAPASAPSVQTPSSVFADMANHWAKDAVEALKAKGVVSGVGNGNYEPDRQLTRAEFAKMIAESFFASQAQGEADFADVASNSWYAPYVAKLASLGVINGMGDGTFAPDMPVSRQDAALIMHRTAKLAGVSLEAVREGVAFKDTISDYASDAVDALYRAGLINGMSADSFDAYSNVTRAQAAQLVYNMIK